MLLFEAVQTQNTDLKEQTASRDSLPAVTHIGRIGLNKSYKVNEGVGLKEPGGGGGGGGGGAEQHREE